MKIEGIRAFSFNNFKKYNQRPRFSQNIADTFEFRGGTPRTFEPFYIVKMDGTERQRFLTPTEAARKARIERNAIVSSLDGICRRAKDYLTINASEVETTDEKGVIRLDEKKFQKVFNEKLAKIPKEEPIYAIRPDGSELTRFDDYTSCARTLSTGKDNVTGCLKGRTKITSGFFIIRASDVETLDEKGNPILDEEKFQKVFDEKLSTLKASRAKAAATDIPIYTVEIGCPETLTRYDGINQAANKLSINRDNIVSCLKGKTKKTGYYFIFDAKDIEKTDEQGNQVVDIEQFKKLYELKMEAVSQIKPRRRAKYLLD